VTLISGFSTGAIIRDSKSIAHRDARTTSAIVSSNTKKSPTVSQKLNQSSWSVDSILALSGNLFASPKTSYDPRRAIIDTATGHMDVRMYDVTYNRAKLPIVQLAEA